MRRMQHLRAHRAQSQATKATQPTVAHDDEAAGPSLVRFLHHSLRWGRGLQHLARHGHVMSSHRVLDPLHSRIHHRLRTLLLLE